MWVYPFEEAWRVWLALALLSLIAGISAARTRSGPMRTLASWLAAGQVLLAVLAVISAIEAQIVEQRSAAELLPIAIGLLVNAAIVFAGIAIGLRACERVHEPLSVLHEDHPCGIGRSLGAPLVRGELPVERLPLAEQPGVGQPRRCGGDLLGLCGHFPSPPLRIGAPQRAPCPALPYAGREYRPVSRTDERPASSVP